MKVKLNPMFEQVSGQLGDIVFRELRGKTVVSRKPTLNATASADQTAHRERFKQAAAYGKSALADAETRAIYEEYAKSKNMPVFALTIADYFTAPVIDDLDLAMYTGPADSLIHITAHDEFGVAGVHVTITDQAGNPLESGEATEAEAGSGHWIYNATSNVEAGTLVTVNAIASDHPGGAAVSSASKSF